jgi:hypothetical protein
MSAGLIQPTAGDGPKRLAALAETARVAQAARLPKPVSIPAPVSERIP